MDLALLQKLNRARQAREPAILITDLESGAQRLCHEPEITDDPLGSLLSETIVSGKSRLFDRDGKSYLLTLYAPPTRLLLIGAVHISQALSPMARLLDIDVAIIDPRTAFATEERFPNVPLWAQWPQDTLPALNLDRHCAVVLLTHDPKIDDPALFAALRSPCFYIGALGSRKTHQARLERLQQAGFGEADAARICAPIGLDIGALSPAEIACSILAEIILHQHKKPLRRGSA